MVDISAFGWAYLRTLVNAWLAVALVVLGLNDVAARFLGKSWEWPREHRWRAAVAVLVIAQFGAYRSLMLKSEADKGASESALASMTNQRDEARTAKARLEGALSAKDQLLSELQQGSNQLRDRLADARNARPLEVKVPASGVPVEVSPPILEGLRLTQQRVSSSMPELPYGLQVTIQTDVVIQPMYLMVYCTGAILAHRISVPLPGGTGVMAGGAAPLEPDRKRYRITYHNLAFTPQVPIVVTFLSKENIQCERVERQQ